jgi:hypothetical protein
MTTYTKPAVRNAWAQTATINDIQDPGSTYASAGWPSGKPPRQYFNWVLNYTSAAVRYFCQQGIPTWDAAEPYPVNAVTINSVDGAIYRCINANGQGQRPDGSLFTSWDIPLVNTAPPSDNSARITNTTWVRGYALPNGTTVGSLPGTVTTAQVPLNTVQQWQASLIIGGNQISGAVPQANQLFLTSGHYATFNWSGQSGQPQWLFGSNDGINVFVWNPSNFSVANATTVAGLSVTSGASGNTVMARDVNGYAFAGYFNQASPNNENGAISQIMVTNGSDGFLRKASPAAVAAVLGSVTPTGNTLVQRDASGFIYAQYLNQASGNNENPPISQIMVTNGSDGFLRKATPAAVAAALAAWTSSNSPFSSAGYQQFLAGGIIQAGRAVVNTSSTTIVFPLSFPHACFAVSFTPEGTNNQPFLTNPPSAGFFQAAGGPAEVDYIAFGW